MPREKIKFALRILPETQQTVKDFYPLDNCQNQSEFIEKAILRGGVARAGAQRDPRSLSRTIFVG